VIESSILSVTDSIDLSTDSSEPEDAPEPEVSKLKLVLERCLTGTSTKKAIPDLKESVQKTTQHLCLGVSTQSVEMKRRQNTKKLKILS
jgi:hypothetical protein